MSFSFKASIAILGLATAPVPAWSAGGPTTETLLFVRHGEKPPEGLGQLDCQGLNRALALPRVIRSQYKRLDAVFAPNPAQSKPDGTGTYDYVRPLATAEPAAIAFGLPIHAEIGYTDTAKLKAALLEPAYGDAVVLVVWEHHQLDDLVPDLISLFGGDPKVVPKWSSKDFDSIWRVTIQRTDAKTTIAFDHDHEGLDGQPATCPN